ncbi:MAG: hypothetical protein ABFS35_12680 [Bacteroidota bacterium]
MKIFTHKFVLGFSFVLSLLLFPSCFEIIEEVNLNDDGSGTFNFTVNMSQSKLNINSMLLLDSVNGRPVPKIEDFKENLEHLKTILNNDSSISNVLVKENWEDYIFSISGDFKDIETLNKSINNINTTLSRPNGYTPIIKNNFSYTEKIFTRLYSYNLINEYNTLSEKDKSVFKNAKYTTIYRFKSPVSNYSNPDALKSKSGKAVMLKVNVKDLITNKKTIKNTIHLK